MRGGAGCCWVMMGCVGWSPIVMCCAVGYVVVQSDGWVMLGHALKARCHGAAQFMCWMVSDDAGT